MKQRSTLRAALLLWLWGLLGGAMPVLAGDSVVTDPLNGFKAATLGATRLLGEQGAQIKVISRAPPAQFYPKEALTSRVTGKVLLDLLIDSEGNVKDALVLEEDPLGLGFGDAAIAAARTYKLTNPYKKLVIIKIRTQFAP
jgi:hypothetical protein